MLRDKDIDILSSIEGFNFAEAYARAEWLILDEGRMRVPSTTDLVAAKRASLASGNDPVAHAQDQQDIELLLSSGKT
jgi:hypothetical protein